VALSVQSAVCICNKVNVSVEMTILYEPEISTAGHYEPEIPTAVHYEITASHYEITASRYEFKNGACQ
jgi:hypothetical protein